MSDNAIPTAEAILNSLRDANIPNAVIARKLALAPSAVTNLFAGTRTLKLHEANILLSLLPTAPKPAQIPVIGMAGAGRWLEAIQEARTTLALPAEANVRGKFGVDVVGDSMNQLLPEGSVAIIDPDDTALFSGKIYLLLNGDGEATIKRYRVDPARFEPVSDNDEYVPFEIGTTDFRVVGRVTFGIQRF